MGNRWSVKTYTFISEGEEPRTITFNTLTLDDYLVSGKLTKTLNDTSKVEFVIPWQQGKDLFPCQTLVEVRFGSGDNWDRKFFGTLVKKVYDNQNGTYSFEATGVLGSYQFIPNYKKYNVGTIESYIETEKSRFKGTAVSPYDCESPWNMLYNNYADIPSTFGDIETENIGLTPAFNLNLRTSCANAYEFLRMITRKENYVFPPSEPRKRPLYWYEDGEKAYFKRIRFPSTIGTAQIVNFRTNLISYTLEEKATGSKVRVENTVKGPGVVSGITWSNPSYPVPFNYKEITPSNKTNQSAYTLDELEQVATINLAEPYYIEAVAYDEHVHNPSIPWFDMGEQVTTYLYKDGGVVVFDLNITKIVYDLVNSANDRVNLGSIAKTFIADSAEQEMDFDADLQDKVGSYGDTKIVIRDRIFGTCNLIDMASLENGVFDSSANIVYGNTTRLVTEAYAKVDASTTYTISVLPNTIRFGDFACYNASKTYIGLVTAVTSNTESTYTFTTLANTKYVRGVLLKKNTSATLNPSEVTSLQLEKGSSASSYVPYAMDNVELTERCREWKALGQWINTVTLPSYATEFMIMPIINGTYRFPHKLFKVSNMIASATMLLFDTEKGSNWYSATFTYNPSTRVATLGTVTKQTWSSVAFYAYAK